MAQPAHLTLQQEKWFASVREGIARDTGRTLEEWVELARACPETAHRKRLAWMKQQYGLGQNRASMVLNEAFPANSGGAKPEALADTLWADPQARGVQEAVHAIVMTLPDVIMGQRKSFTAYSRKLQFCALRPVKTGAVLGLALPPETDLALMPRGRESWSERLKGQMPLPSPDDVTERVGALLRMAWEVS